jgi:hypothetical protein
VTREKHRLRAIENKMLRGILENKCDDGNNGIIKRLIISTLHK